MTETIDYSSLFQGVVAEALKGIQATLPIAVPVFGVMLAVSLGIKIFKKFTGKA